MKNQKPSPEYPTLVKFVEAYRAGKVSDTRLAAELDLYPLNELAAFIALELLRRPAPFVQPEEVSDASDISIADRLATSCASIFAGLRPDDKIRCRIPSTEDIVDAVVVKAKNCHGEVCVASNAAGCRNVFFITVDDLVDVVALPSLGVGI